MKASRLVSRPRRTRGRTYVVGIISAVGLGSLAAAVACSNSTPTQGTEATLDIDSDTIFELDGNALDGAPTGDDWSTLYAGGGSSIVYTGVLADPAPTSIFFSSAVSVSSVPVVRSP